MPAPGQWAELDNLRDNRLRVIRQGFKQPKAEWVENENLSYKPSLLSLQHDAGERDDEGMRNNRRLLLQRATTHSYYDRMKGSTEFQSLP